MMPDLHRGAGRSRTVAAAASAALCLFSGVASGGLAPFELEDGVLEMTTDGAVQIIDARITLGRSGKVKARYTFWNESSAPRTLTVGLPSMRGVVVAADGTETVTAIEDFSVSVDGVKPQVVTRTMDCTGPGCYDQVFLFEATFDPHANVVVQLAWKQPPSRTELAGEAAGTYLDWIFETDARWRGDVGNFTVIASVDGDVCQPFTVLDVDARAAMACKPGDGKCAGTVIGKPQGRLELWGEHEVDWKVVSKKSGIRLELHEQDVEPAGHVTVLVPDAGVACAWDPSLVTEPLEQVCGFAGVVAASKQDLDGIASGFDLERARVCKALPSYLMGGGSVLGGTFEGVESAVIEKHYSKPQHNPVPLYRKPGQVPDLKKFLSVMSKVVTKLAS